MEPKRRAPIWRLTQQLVVLGQIVAEFIAVNVQIVLVIGKGGGWEEVV